jgi:hypothetical protein
MGKSYINFIDVGMKTVLASTKIYNTSYMCRVIENTRPIKEQSSS